MSVAISRYNFSGDSHVASLLGMTIKLHKESPPLGAAISLRKFLFVVFEKIVIGSYIGKFCPFAICHRDAI